jgi:formylglycine-generating enzyme required for sulfatase activity
MSHCVRLIAMIGCALACAQIGPAQAAGPLTAGEERGLAAGDTFTECDVCPEMVVVPPGSYLMGSPKNEVGSDPREGPRHRVKIARPFAVGKFEVTLAQWLACVAAGECKHSPPDNPDAPDAKDRGQRAVTFVSWTDITREYLPWLSRKAGKTYRLLSEAEWEYSARAGTTTPYFTGRNITNKQANFNRRNVSPLEGVADVGSYAPNAFGLYDMHGNALEWVQDCWNESYRGAPSDGSAWTSGDCVYRVTRGGSWNSDPGKTAPWDLRADFRSLDNVRNRCFVCGFRVGRSLAAD